jgi:hypothetical protein
MDLDAAHRPSAPGGPLSKHLHNKLEAAMIMRGLVQLVLDQGPVEVLPRTWYREGGTHYLEARRRAGVPGRAHPVAAGRGGRVVSGPGGHAAG